MDAKSPLILNIDALEYRPVDHGEKFAAKVGDVGVRIGASKLGYNVCVVPPGKRAFPRHNHMANEEMFFVLEGAGEIVIGSERFPVRQGDFIASPAGGADTAHQIVNTSGAELKYIALSTKLTPEIVEYPDSKKFGAAAFVPGADGKPQLKRFIAREQGIDYWDGED